MISINSENGSAQTAQIDCTQPFKLGDIIVKPATNELIKNGQAISVEHKVMRVLVYLCSKHDQIVSRDELFEQIWSDVYVSQEALTRCVSILRKLLNDRQEDRRIILTIRNQGYRVIGPIQALDGKNESPGKPAFNMSFKRMKFAYMGVMTVIGTLSLGFLCYCVIVAVFA